MSTWVVQVAVVALFALTCGLLVAAWLNGRLGVAAIVLLIVAIVIWAIAFVAIGTGYRDANDFATCGTDCSTTHYISAVAFVAPPLLISLAALGMLVARGSRWRARRTASRENPV